MNPAIEQELENFDALIRELGKQSHHTEHEYPKAVAMFVRLYLAGERPHPDDVKHWVRDHGWREEDARDLGEMADVVGHTLREIGRI